MSIFFDNFTVSQAGNTGALPYTSSGGNWAPPSSRNLTYTNLTSSTISTSFGSSTLTAITIASTAGSQTLTYTFSPAADFTFLQNITFTNCYSYALSPGYTVNIQVLANGNQVGTANPTLDNSVKISVPIAISGAGKGTTTLAFVFNFPATSQYAFVFGSFSSTFLCLAQNSLILTSNGYRAIQDLQRGHQVEGGRIARIIKEELDPSHQVEIVSFYPSSLEPGLPRERILACSEHYFIYRGQRWLAKSFLPFPGVHLLQGSAKDILPPAADGKYYMYDLQFDYEGSYVVAGLTSQSRSPYCQITPLPKELYFRQENYKEERVANTLTSQPAISYNYLFPDGEEYPSFTKITPRS